MSARGRGSAGLVALACSLLAFAPAASGALDRGFSGDGRQTTDFGGGSDGASGMVLQPDGKIVVVGSSSGGDFALARYGRDGSLDPSFSGDGKQTTDFGGESERASGVALQADGKIVAAGTSASGDFLVARYNRDGSLDTSFSGDGRTTTDFGGAFDGAQAVAVQRDGGIVVAGGAGAIDPSDFALARYKPDGSLDPSFSGDGKAISDYGAIDSLSALALQPDGKIVAAGRSGGMSSSRFMVLRYNPDGTPDRTFSANGNVETNFGNEFEPDEDFGGAVGVQSDGKVVAAGGGSASFTGFLRFALARYSPNGSFDRRFSGDGRQTTDFGGRAAANSLALPPSGGVVAGGSSHPFAGTRQDFALARYRVDGSLSGREVTDFGGDSQANAIAVQPDGAIVAAGDAGGDFAIARYSNLTLSPPHLSLRIGRRHRLRGLVRAGLGFRATVNEQARLVANLEISRSLARRLGIVRGRRARGRAPVAIGRAASRLEAGRAGRVRITVARSIKRRLRRGRRVRATLLVRVMDAEGNAPVAKRRLRFR